MDFPIGTELEFKFDQAFYYIMDAVVSLCQLLKALIFIKTHPRPPEDILKIDWCKLLNLLCKSLYIP